MTEQARFRGITPERRALTIRAQALRREGKFVREIAVTLGVSRSYAAELLADPDGRTRRMQRDGYAGTCVDCGGPTTHNGTSRPHERCTQCSANRLGWEKRGTGFRQRQVTALLQSRPRRKSELRAALGVTDNNAGVILWNMVRFGLVERVGRGIYRLPTTSAQATAKRSLPKKKAP